MQAAMDRLVVTREQIRHRSETTVLFGEEQEEVPLVPTPVPDGKDSDILSIIFS